MSFVIARRSLGWDATSPFEIVSRSNLFYIAMLVWNWKEWSTVFGPVTWIDNDGDSLRAEIRDGQDAFLWTLVGEDNGAYLIPGAKEWSGSHGYTTQSFVKAAKSRADAGWNAKWQPDWRLSDLYGLTVEAPPEVPAKTVWVGCEKCAVSGNEDDCPHTESASLGVWLAIDEIDLNDSSLEKLCWDVSADHTLGPLACIAAGVLLRLFLKPQARTKDIATVTEKALAIRDSLSAAEQKIVDDDLMYRAGVLGESVIDNPTKPLVAGTPTLEARPGSPEWRERALELYSGDPWSSPFFFESCKGAEHLSSIFARLSPVPEMVLWFSKANSPHVRRAAAGNPHIPQERLFDLAHDEGDLVRGEVGLNPSSPLELLIQLAEDSASWTRKGVARNPALPLEVITKLLNDNLAVRTELAKNPRVLVETLELLAESHSVSVQEGVAENPSTPEYLLLKLAVNDDKGVRARVARNPNLPHDTLMQLLSDPQETVRRSALQNPAMPVQKLEEIAANLPNSPGLAAPLLRNPATPLGILMQLAETHNVAMHPNAPPELVDYLADDSSVDTRAAAMQHPNVTAATFVRVFGNLSAMDH